jgi:hypothetical protein
LTAGFHERFYRFVYTCGVLVVFDGNDDAALIAPNGNDLQSRVLPLSGSFQKVLCVILLCDLRKAPLLYGLHRISINRRRVPVNKTVAVLVLDPLVAWMIKGTAATIQPQRVSVKIQAGSTKPLKHLFVTMAFPLIALLLPQFRPPAFLHLRSARVHKARPP